jgi:integrase
MPTRTTPLISVAIRDYSDSRIDDISPIAHRDECYLLQRFLRHTGDKQLGRLTALDVERFFRDLRRGDVATLDGRGSRPVGASQHNVARSRVRGFVAWGHRHGYCRGDLADGVRIAPLPPRRKFLRLNPTQLLALVEQPAHPRDRGMIAVAINTALRGKELRDLRVGDPDLDSERLFVTVTKTAESDWMPISSDLDAELRRWLTWYAEHVDGSLRDDWYLFPARRRDTFVSRGVRRQGCLDPERRMSTHPSTVVHAALAGIGIEETAREGMHTIRRSVARIYFDACSADMGYSNALREVMALLHHRSVATTEKYLGLDVERAARDRRIAGKPFLTSMTTTENVVPLRARQ